MCPAFSPPRYLAHEDPTRVLGPGEPSRCFTVRAPLDTPLQVPSTTETYV